MRSAVAIAEARRPFDVDLVGNDRVPPRERRRRNREPWERDWVARRLVLDHPDGLTLVEIGAYFGLSPQGAQKIVDRALAKIRRREGA